MSKVELHRGDCLDVMWQIPSGSVDAIIADLPYGTTACSWDVVIPFEPLWAHYKRIIKPRGAVVLFGSQPFTSLLVCSNLEWFKYCWYWRKNRVSGFQFAKIQPTRCVEELCVFYREQPTYNKQPTESIIADRLRIPGRPNGRNSLTKSEHVPGLKKSVPMVFNEYVEPRNCLEFDCVPSATGTLHPTQKPVALLEYLIKTYTNEGDTVMDNVMGSGTAGVACVRLNRNFIGIEKDADYFEVARKRIESEQENIESTLFYQAEKRQEPKPVQPTLFAATQ